MSTDFVNGDKVKIKGTRDRLCRGVVVQETVRSSERVLVEFPAHPNTGCSTERMWIEKERLVARK